MFNLRTVQAEFGDCLIVEFGTSQTPRYLLVDGGPEGTYPSHLKHELSSIVQSGSELDIVILSHVDEDHIIGLLDLMADLDDDRANGRSPLIGIKEIWHNSFHMTIGHNNEVERRLHEALSGMDGAKSFMVQSKMALDSISQGDQLRRAALRLHLPVNQSFNSDLITVDTISTPLQFENLSIQVVGPTEENLDELRRMWLEWLDQNENRLASADPAVSAMADKSIPNLSSIMLLLEADGKSMLLTGDGRGDHLLQGLERVGRLAQDGTIHVDLLKLPHHGSDRNITRTFFKKVTADKYVACANGKHGNPDLQTLKWIVETAHEDRRSIEILATNTTPSISTLLTSHSPSTFGYTMTVLPRDQHALHLTLA